MADQPNWTPVAKDAVGAWGSAPEAVQIAVVIGVVVVALAIVGAWYFRRRDGQTVPAEVLVSVTNEFSHQVAQLAEAVEGMSKVVKDMRQTIVGCSTCPFHPNAAKRLPKPEGGA